MRPPKTMPKLQRTGTYSPIFRTASRSWTPTPPRDCTTASGRYHPLRSSSAPFHVEPSTTAAALVRTGKYCSVYNAAAAAQGKASLVKEFDHVAPEPADAGYYDGGCDQEDYSYTDEQYDGDYYEEVYNQYDHGYNCTYSYPPPPQQPTASYNYGQLQPPPPPP